MLILKQSRKSTRLVRSISLDIVVYSGKIQVVKASTSYRIESTKVRCFLQLLELLIIDIRGSSG